MDSLIAGMIPTITWSVFLGSAALAIVCGAIFAYHWFRYAMNHAGALFALVTYSVVSAFLLLGILAATIALNYSA